MSATKDNISSAIKVAITFTILTSGAYAALIPMFAPDYKTPSIFVIGAVTAGLINGYIGYHVAADDILPIKIGFSFCYAITTIFIVSSASLLITLNIRGA